jgi:hypothetical protein
VKARFAILAGCIALIAAALPLSAHHSFAAEFDNAKPVNVTGKVVKLDWVNPHSHLYFDVTTTDGKVEHWTAEMFPPNGLYRAGWRPNMLKGGEEITIHGYLAKDGTNYMWAQSVDFADGRKFTLGGGPEAQSGGPK